MKNIVGNNQREIIRLNKKPIITVEIFYNSLFGKEIFMNKKLFKSFGREFSVTCLRDESPFFYQKFVTIYVDNKY